MQFYCQFRHTLKIVAELCTPLETTMDLTYLFLLELIPAEILPIINIFKHKNIHQTIHFHCNKAESAIYIDKVFHDHQIRIASLNDYNNSYKLPFSYPKVGIILNSSCEGWSSIFETLKSERLFKSPFNWLIITEYISSTVEILSKYPLEVDSDVTLIYKNSEKLFHFYEVYNTGFYTHGKIVLNKIGFWDSTFHFDRRNRMNLSGVVLRGTVVITQKIVDETFEEYVERSRLSKSDTIHKLKYFTLLKYLRDMYNFSYILRRTNSWGYLHNDSFDGMVGSLQRQEADIGCSPIYFRPERAKVLDATIEVWPSKAKFILRHPKHPGGYYTIFTRPLTTKVWYCIVAVLSVATGILCVMSNLRALQHAGDDGDSSASLAVLTIWSAICQQGSSLSKGSTSIKLVTFVTCLFALTVYQYYNATVVSTLLREPPKNIRTPMDLLRSNLKCGVHDVLYNKDFFKRTTDPIALEIYSKKIVTTKEQNFYSLEYGLELVKRGGFAFLVDSAIAYGIMRSTFNEMELCDAHEIALYPPQNLVAVVRKGSPYREHFAYGLRKMFESGLMHRIRSVWDEPRPACVRTPDTSLISVSVREFSTALLVLAGGILAAGVVLAVEIVTYRPRVARALRK